MKIIENAIEYVKEFFKNDHSGHDYSHTMRVYKNAMKISEKEDADTFIVALSALHHDVDDEKISPETSKNKTNARKFMEENNVDSDIEEKVIEIINEISFSGNHKTPNSIEGKIVQDADRLDAIGAIGIARTFTFGGNKNRKMYDFDIKPKDNLNKENYRDDNNTTINHFYEKLLKLKDLMNTKTAKIEASKRHEFMETFLKEFYAKIDDK